MKRKITGSLILLALLIAAFSFGNRSGWAPLRVYNRGGELSIEGSKIFRDTFTIVNGNGVALDISAAGFTEMPKIQAIALRNTADSSLVPNVAVKSVTPTQVVLNVTEANIDAWINVNAVGIGLIRAMQAGSSPVKFVRSPTVIHLQCTGK